MKRGFALCLLAAALLGCQDKTGARTGSTTAAGSVDSIDQLKTENQDLRNRNTQLEMVNEQQSQMLAQYTEKLNQILDALDAINGKSLGPPSERPGFQEEVTRYREIIERRVKG